VLAVRKQMATGCTSHQGHQCTNYAVT